MFKIFLLFPFILVSLIGCVTASTLGVSGSEWDSYSPEEKEKMVDGYYKVLKNSKSYKGESDNTTVHVSLSGGTANMPPYDKPCAYKPVEFEVDSGNCTDIRLTSMDGGDNTKLKVCYYNKTLFIDPSRYDVAKSEASIRLHASPVWSRGFTFNGVSSSGFVRLSNVNISVRMLSIDEPQPEA